jgi:hypothetical protein
MVAKKPNIRWLRSQYTQYAQRCSAFSCRNWSPSDVSLHHVSSAEQELNLVFIDLRWQILGLEGAG